MFKNLFYKIFGIKEVEKTFIHGAVLDDADVLAAQPKFEEIVAKANPVIWKPLDISKFPDYPIRNQDSSSGCVSFTLSLIGSIIYYFRTGNWVPFSPAWIYSQRSNKPREGMIGTNAFELAETVGLLPDQFLPSDNLSEMDMNYPKVFSWYAKVAEIFKLDTQLVILPIKDIETAASVIQTSQKPLMVWFDFGPGEWVQVPKILSSYTPYRHSVTFIPPSNPTEMTYGIYEGEKAIIIQDSWGKDLETIGGKRIIKESFFKARNVFAVYPFRFKFDAVNGKPSFDGSTKSLQDCLKYDGEFPTNIDSTGTLGPITISSIKLFQKKYNIDQTGTVGPKTTMKLKELFP